MSNTTFNEELKKTLYTKLHCLRLEVHASIVDDIKKTVDELFTTPTSPKEVKNAESVEAWYHNWMKEKGKTGGAVTVNVLDMLKDFASQFPLGAPVSKDALTQAEEPTASDITSLFKNQKQ